MNKTKKNKIVTEFLGYRLVSCNNGVAWENTLSNKAIDDIFSIHGRLYTERSNYMKFDSSWDWLMPVLKKIILILTPQNYSEWRMITNPTEYDIKEVYNQAVQFIEWHNKQSN